MSRTVGLGRDVAGYIASRPPDWALHEVDVVELRRLSLAGTQESVRPVTDGVVRTELEVELPGRRLPVWVFRPEGAGPRPLPTLVWFPGGGFVLGGPDNVVDLCAQLCVESGCQVVCVGYRLGPEHRWPLGHDDALATLKWLLADEPAGGAAVQVDRRAVAVGGDSAGAHVAAHTALRWRGAGGREPGADRPELVQQVLLYPVVSATTDTGSYREFATGHGLTREQMRWFLASYGPLGPACEVPFDLLAADDLAGVCPAYVVTAECDVLRDEGEAYAAALDRAGVAVTALRYQGMPHGFCQMTAVTETGWRAVAAAGRQVGEALQAAGEIRTPSANGRRPTSTLPPDAPTTTTAVDGALR